MLKIKHGKVTKGLAVLLTSVMLFNPVGGYHTVSATETVTTDSAADNAASNTTDTTNASTSTGSSSSSTNSSDTNTDANGTLGKNSDVGIELSKSITGVSGSKVTVAFKLKSGNTTNIKLKSVYPVIDTMFPFETSGDAYKVVSAGDDEAKQKELEAEFNLTARSDLSNGYQSVRFIGEYTKIANDGTSADYYVIKTINIYFSESAGTTESSKSSSSGKSNTGSGSSSSSSSSSDDDDDDDDGGSSYSPSYGGGGSSSSDGDGEVTAPKLIIEGFDTDPKKVMAGKSFKMKIHVKNSSKSTNVCNGKFLIGDEAGNFLPTSGSNAVYVEKIAAGETGDIEIELKTSADLAQKNYRLMIKGDFDDGNGSTFSASESVYLPVYQEVKLNVTDVSMTPESIGVGDTGSLVFTINNQGSAGVYNVNVSTKDDAVTAQESYVGNIAANSSAYATLQVTGQDENIDKGTIKVIVSYEDSEGTKGELEQEVNCLVGVSSASDDFDDDFEDYEDYEEEGIPWWVWLIIGIVALVAIIVIIVILNVRKKKKLKKLMEEEDEFDDFAGSGEGSESDETSDTMSMDYKSAFGDDKESESESAFGGDKESGSEDDVEWRNKDA